uniref:Putative ovule protein n=1 Tax=Solanum chacoense TaxID=4108 RepID=A0A0V0HSN8_SOLCH
MVCDIIVDVSTPQDYRPTIFESISLEDILCVKPHFHSYLMYCIIEFALHIFRLSPAQPKTFSLQSLSPHLSLNIHLIASHQ